MGDFRSKSFADGRMQMEGYYGYKPSSNPDEQREESYYGHKPSSKPDIFRSQSVSYSSSYDYAPPPPNDQTGSHYGHKPSSKPDRFRSQSVSYSSSCDYAPPPPHEQTGSYYGHKPSSKPDRFRSQSVSYSSSYDYAPPPQNQIVPVQDLKLKKAKSSKSWGLTDPEFQRKKRVASYKVYAVEGKVKGSLRKSFKWIKDRYTRAVYGWW